MQKSGPDEKDDSSLDVPPDDVPELFADELDSFDDVAEELSAEVALLDSVELVWSLDDDSKELKLSTLDSFEENDDSRELELLVSEELLELDELLEELEELDSSGSSIPVTMMGWTSHWGTRFLSR